VPQEVEEKVLVALVTADEVGADAVKVLIDARSGVWRSIGLHSRSAASRTRDESADGTGASLHSPSTAFVPLRDVAMQIETQKPCGVNHTVDELLQVTEAR
jgi:hypothetical protein